MLNRRNRPRRKAPDEAGYQHPLVFPRRLRAACFSVIGVTTAVALIIVGLFANVGLSFMPLPGLGIPSAPSPARIGAGHALVAVEPRGGTGGVGANGGGAAGGGANPAGAAATGAPIELPTALVASTGGGAPPSSGGTPTGGAARGIEGSRRLDSNEPATGERGESQGVVGNGKPKGKTSIVTGTPAPTTPMAPTETAGSGEEASAVLVASGASDAEGGGSATGETSGPSGSRPGKSTSTAKPGGEEELESVEGETGEPTEETEAVPPHEWPTRPPHGPEGEEPEEAEVEAPAPEGEAELEAEPETTPETTPPPAPEPPATTTPPVEEAIAELGEAPPATPVE